MSLAFRGVFFLLEYLEIGMWLPGGDTEGRARFCGDMRRS